MFRATEMGNSHNSQNHNKSRQKCKQFYPAHTLLRFVPIHLFLCFIPGRHDLYLLLVYGIVHRVALSFVSTSAFSVGV